MGRLIVDPRMALPYYTYIIQGFQDLGEMQSLQFHRLDAPLSDDAEGAAMRYDTREGSTRLFVSTGDHSTIGSDLLEWADVYGKVNVDAASSAAAEVIALGPTFGITRWSLPAGYLVAGRMALGGSTFERAVRQMRFQAKARLPISAYSPAPSERGAYVFHASRRWSGRHEPTNELRHRFFEACRSIDVDVDGGLLTDRLPLSEYLARTRRSALVFNCPAVHSCLGWKLGEYLALGKAIVSTPLSRELPAPLEHGTHAHFVDNDVAAIAEGVEAVMRDLDYRRHLETGARDWFERHLAPGRVVRRMLDLVT